MVRGLIRNGIFWWQTDRDPSTCECHGPKPLSEGAGAQSRAKDRELQVMIDSSRDISLELGLLKDKVNFFEEVFGIHLVLKRRRRA